MTEQSKSRNWLIFIVVLSALLMLGFLVGVPLLEKRIAARFVDEFQSTATAGYQIEEPGASIFRRSFTTGKFSFTMPSTEDAPGGFFSCASTERSGMDWGTLFGYYPEMSAFGLVKALDCQITSTNGASVTIKEISASDLRYRHKALLDFSRKYKEDFSKATMYSFLAALKDCGTSNITIKGLDISAAMASFSLAHAEVNDFDYLRGHDKAVAKDLQLMFLGQKLFALDEMSADYIKWGFVAVLMKNIGLGPDDLRLNPEKLANAFSDNPLEVRNFKLKGLMISGSEILNGSNEKIIDGKEITLNLRQDENLMVDLAIGGLGINLATLKKVPAAQKFIGAYSAPLKLDGSFRSTLIPFSNPALLEISASLADENLGGAKLDMNGRSLDPRMPIRNGNMAIKDMELSVTDTGLVDLVCYMLASDGVAPGAIKNELLNGLSEKQDKDFAPADVKNRQALRGFLSKGGTIDMKMHLPDFVPVEDVEKHSGMAEINWVPPKQ